MLIIVHGLPGTGKSTIGKIISGYLNGIVLNSDEIRKKLFQEFNYDLKEREFIYNSIALFIEKIPTDRAVIIDATFSRKRFRDIFETLALNLQTQIFYIKCVCSEIVCFERIKDRGGSFSDANRDVYYKVKAEWDENEYHNCLTINTEDNISDNLQKILQFIHVPAQMVPLTPADINLVNSPNDLKKWLLLLHNIFTLNSIEYYIQSSLAAYVYGIDNRNVTDIDIRANYKIEDLFLILKSKFSTINLRDEVIYAEGEFRNKCIIIEVPELGTHIDITTEIITYRKDVDIVFNIPFDRNYTFRKIHSLIQRKFPVCSIQYLVIYKLVNQRGKIERKNDLKEAANLLVKS